MNFYRWMIKKHINDHAPVGDLARDMKGDKQFPHDGDKAKIQEYLDGCGACSGCISNRKQTDDHRCQLWR